MNPILENTLQYTHIQFYMVSHFLTFGYAAMACGLLYFGFTAFMMKPENRLGNILSMVVMVSAFLILKEQSDGWLGSFTKEGTMWTSNNNMDFSNAYRYLNWLIDVPVLLTILLVGLGQSSSKDFMKKWTIFTVCGVLMIVTGYIGQFHQLGDTFQWYLWFGISSVFYVIILAQAKGVISTAVSTVPTEVQGLTKSIFWIFLVFWNLYLVAYLIPAFMPNAWGVVWKQGLYTVADVGSKVIYGIILTQITFAIDAKQTKKLNSQ
jgi:bacteriorhodopsin